MNHRSDNTEVYRLYICQFSCDENGQTFIFLHISNSVETVCFLVNLGVLTFHPVTLKVFPALPIVIVLSHIPGREAAEETGSV